MIEKHSIQLKNSLEGEIRELIDKLNFAWKWLDAPERTEIEITMGIERFGQLYSRAVYVTDSLRQKFDLRIGSVYNGSKDQFAYGAVEPINPTKKEVVTFTPISENGKEGKEKVWKGDSSKVIKKKKGREKMYEGLPFDLLPNKEKMRRLQPTIFKEKK